MSEHHEYHFFLDGKRFDSSQESLTGADIKKLAGAPAAYQLFLETEGDAPDRPISDAEAISLKGEPKHFFAVPPATFGA